MKLEKAVTLLVAGDFVIRESRSYEVELNVDEVVTMFDPLANESFRMGHDQLVKWLSDAESFKAVSRQRFSCCECGLDMTFDEVESIDYDGLQFCHQCTQDIKG